MGAERMVAIVPAAGRGVRMGGAGNKLFLPLGDRPILAHTLGLLESCDSVDDVVVAVGEGEEDRFRREVQEPFGLHKVSGVVRGGSTRQESVARCLDYIGSAASVAIVHDGARPLLPAWLLEKAVRLGRELGALVVGLPVRDTLKQVSRGGPPPAAAAAAGPSGAVPPPGQAPAMIKATVRSSRTTEADESGDDLVRVVATLPRDDVWSVQTPQVFWLDLLQMAYRRAHEDGVLLTDDAGLVERLRHPVSLLPGSEENLKITTQLDLVLARAVLEWRARSARAGGGQG